MVVSFQAKRAKHPRREMLVSSAWYSKRHFWFLVSVGWLQIITSIEKLLFRVPGACFAHFVSMFDMVNGQVCNQESYLSACTPWFFWPDALVWLPCLWSRSFMPTVTQAWRLAFQCISPTESHPQFLTESCRVSDDRYRFKTCHALILMSLSIVSCVLYIFTLLYGVHGTFPKLSSTVGMDSTTCAYPVGAYMHWCICAQPCIQQKHSKIRKDIYVDGQYLPACLLTYLACNKDLWICVSFNWSIYQAINLISNGIPSLPSMQAFHILTWCMYIICFFLMIF